MKFRTVIGLLSLSVAATVLGCAHGTTEKRLDEKLSREAQVTSDKELSEEAQSLIETSPDLTQDQKDRLMALRDSMRQKGRALSEESLKLRSVLIKDVISPNYNAKEVSLIKKRIKAVESQRVSLLFDAVEKANGILGHKAPANRAIINDMAELHRGTMAN